MEDKNIRELSNIYIGSEGSFTFDRIITIRNRFQKTLSIYENKYDSINIHTYRDDGDY